MGFKNFVKNLFVKKEVEPVQSSIEEVEKKSDSVLESYCDDNPDSLECRIYDV